MEGALAIMRQFHFAGGTEIGYERETEAEGQRVEGPTLNLELPIFNQGQARVARAQALVAQSRPPGASSNWRPAMPSGSASNTCASCARSSTPIATS